MFRRAAPQLFFYEKRANIYRPVVTKNIRSEHNIRMKGKFTGRSEVALWRYRQIETHGLPKPVDEQNDYFGPETMPNYIRHAGEYWSKKANDWGYPHRKPPPSGLRHSRDYFPYFFERYFPDTHCRLVLDSVLNVETKEVQFLFEPHMSKQEIRNYLRNIYGIDNIEDVETRNIGGLRYKNELGWIKMAPVHKKATVILDTPTMVQLKQVKDTADAKE